jgi:hypothetical protein
VDWNNFDEKSKEDIRARYPNLFHDNVDHMDAFIEEELQRIRQYATEEHNKAHDWAKSISKRINDEALQNQKPKTSWRNLFQGRRH